MTSTVHKYTVFEHVTSKFLETRSLTVRLTLQIAGPHNSNRTISTFPDQAAKCKGDEPLLSTMFGEASYSRSSLTISLQKKEYALQFAFQ